jgi:transposase
MLTIGARMRIFVGVEPLDMRGSFDALAGAVRRLGLEPTDGHLYLFFNRRRRPCKMIFLDGSGWCLLFEAVRGWDVRVAENV